MQVLGLPFLRSRLLPRFIIGCGSLFIFAVLAMLVTAIVWLRQQALQDSQSRLAQLNVVLAEQVERSFGSIDSVLQTIVSLAKRDDFNDLATRTRLQGYLFRRMEGFPQARSFLVLDRDGNLIIDSRSADPRPYNGIDRENFAVLMAGPSDEMHIDIPVRGRLSKELLFTVSRRLETADGEFAGVVLSAIEISYFNDFFEAVKLVDGSISLWRNDGSYLLSHPFNDDLLGRMIRGRIHSDFMPRVKAAVLREMSPIDGTDRMISFRTLNDYGAFVVVSRSTDAILLPWRHQAFALGLFAGLAIFVLLGIGYVLLAMARAQDHLLLDACEARAAAEYSAKSAEQANQLKSRFFAGVSHDLRTPLNAISGFSDLLLNGYAGPIQEQAREYVGDIQKAGKHLLELLNDLLDMAKVEAGRLTLIEDRFALRGVVDECLRTTMALAAKAGVTLMPYDEREFGLRADQLRLRQILLNLLSNAIKFTPAGGQVAIASMRADDGSLRISVTDDGIGMDKAGIATALEPYGQVINQFTRGREGTGLGLPLVKALIELHNGWLDIKSAPNEGSIFTVVLPAERVLSLKSASRVA